MKNQIKIVECTKRDIPILADMNKQLIEDEHSSNPMSTHELEERMHSFLNETYRAYFLYALDTKDLVGYALIDYNRSPLFLRQFFICRDFRRKHYGTCAFNTLLKYLHTDTIDLDVLPWNERGCLFWDSLGFKPININLRFKI